MAAKGKYKAWRPDKVVMRDHEASNKVRCWKVTKAEIVGDQDVFSAA